VYDVDNLSNNNDDYVNDIHGNNQFWIVYKDFSQEEDDFSREIKLRHTQQYVKLIKLLSY
jgi:hypothetical protein